MRRLILLLLVILCPTSVWAQAAMSQDDYIVGTAANPSTATLGFSTTAGRALIVFTGAQSTTNDPIVSVTVGTETLTAACAGDGTTTHSGVFYQLNQPAQTTPTISTTWTGGTLANRYAVYEFTGLATSSALDQCATDAYTAEDPIAIATLTPSQANTGVLFYFNNTTAFTVDVAAGGIFTPLADTLSIQGYSEWGRSTDTNAIAPSVGVTASESGGSVIVNFKEPAAGTKNQGWMLLFNIFIVGVCLSARFLL